NETSRPRRTSERDQGPLDPGKGKQTAAASQDWMSLILDSGALIALERGHRRMLALIKLELQAGRSLITHGGVIGQVWRGGAGRQANLARLLPYLDVVSL